MSDTPYLDETVRIGDQLLPRLEGAIRQITGAKTG